MPFQIAPSLPFFPQDLDPNSIYLPLLCARFSTGHCGVAASPMPGQRERESELCRGTGAKA